MKVWIVSSPNTIHGVFKHYDDAYAESTKWEFHQIYITQHEVKE